jgi:hypothetical protein
MKRRMTVEEYFQQIAERTEKLLDVLSRSVHDLDAGEDMDLLLKERETLLSALTAKLKQEPYTDRYRDLYERYKQQETLSREKLEQAMAALKQKMQSVKHNRAMANQYDSYLQGPFGAFIDQKK